MTQCKPKKLYVKLKAGTSDLPPLPPLKSPTDAVLAARKVIGDRAYEIFLVLYVNTKNCVFAYEEFTEGSMSGVTVHTSTIVRNAVLTGARAIITFHQHPSGDPAPSDDDFQLWNKLRRQAEVMDLVVLDNFVVTGDPFDGYYSESENE